MGGDGLKILGLESAIVPKRLGIIDEIGSSKNMEMRTVKIRPCKSE
jgi:hypothetical protein